MTRLIYQTRISHLGCLICGEKTDIHAQLSGGSRGEPLTALILHLFEHYSGYHKSTKGSHSHVLTQYFEFGTSRLQPMESSTEAVM